MNLEVLLKRYENGDKPKKSLNRYVKYNFVTIQDFFIIITDNYFYELKYYIQNIENESILQLITNTTYHNMNKIYS